jgi:hypothetical protein
MIDTIQPKSQIPICKLCGRQMHFSCREAIELQYEIETFECTQCHAVAQRNVALPKSEQSS